MSHSRVTALTASAALALAMAATAAPATAADEVRYTGTFTGVAFDPGCSVPAGTTAPDSADGTWRVNLHASKATGRFVINVPAGVPHVAWTTQMTRVSDEATTFTAQAQSPAGTLTVTLLEDGSFTYRISPYNESGVLPGWPVCTGTNGVTYSGELGSAG